MLKDKSPNSYIMTFPFGYNVSCVKKLGIITKTASKKFYTETIVKVKTTFENCVRVYNIERTLCDIVRSNSYEDI
jgi:hypothetical protein